MGKEFINQLERTNTPSSINFVTNLKFTTSNIQMNKKFYRWKRDLVRYQRLNIAYCI